MMDGAIGTSVPSFVRFRGIFQSREINNLGWWRAIPNKDGHSEHWEISVGLGA